MKRFLVFEAMSYRGADERIYGFKILGNAPHLTKSMTWSQKKFPRFFSTD